MFQDVFQTTDFLAIHTGHILYLPNQSAVALFSTHKHTPGKHFRLMATFLANLTSWAVCALPAAMRQRVRVSHPGAGTRAAPEWRQLVLQLRTALGFGHYATETGSGSGWQPAGPWRRPREEALPPARPPAPRSRDDGGRAGSGRPPPAAAAAGSVSAAGPGRGGCGARRAARGAALPLPFLGGCRRCGGGRGPAAAAF